MFRNTGYFNPTGFRRTTLSPYAPVTPQQAANRFTLKYVPSYVPPPPPPPAPVYVPNNDGGWGDDPSPAPAPAAYYGDSMSSNDHEGRGDQGSPGGSPASGGGTSMGSGSGMSGPGDMGSSGDSFGAQSGDYGGMMHSDGGTIPPMYAETGSFVDGVTQTDLDLGTAMALAKDKASSILGTITGQEKESFLAGKTASELGFTSQMLDALSKPETIAGALVGLPPGTTTLAKEIGVPMYNAYIDFVNTYSDQGIANAALEADIAKTLSSPVGIAEQTAVEEKDVGDYSIDDSISIELPSLYDKYSIAAQQELNTAVPSQPPGIGPGPATPSGIPDMGITPATSSSELGAVHGISPDVDAAINDIANEIDASTTSSPPSTMSDHANVHGPDPSPPSSQPPGIGPGPATPSYGGGASPSSSYGSGSQDDGDFGGHPGMGGGSNSPGNDGGHTGGGASDGSEADTGGGYGGLGHSKGGHIYASQGGYVNSTGGK
jgi:hypothetical protein